MGSRVMTHLPRGDCHGWVIISINLIIKGIMMKDGTGRHEDVETGFVCFIFLKRDVHALFQFNVQNTRLCYLITIIEKE